MLASLLLATTLAAEEPLPEGNAYVRGLVTRQRQREEALNRYGYDLEEVSQELDADGNVRKVTTRRYEAFHVRGRPVRKQVAENGQPLSFTAAEGEERRVRELVQDILSERTVHEVPEVRLSRVLERYDFETVRREDRDGRPTLVFEFKAVPGKRDLEGDFFLRHLTGCIWVDEEERELVQAELKNAEPIKLAFGVGVSVTSLEIKLSFRQIDDGLWLPARVQFGAAGRALLVSGFRLRTLMLFSRFRRFEAETQSEKMRPPR